MFSILWSTFQSITLAILVAYRTILLPVISKNSTTTIIISTLAISYKFFYQQFFTVLLVLYTQSLQKLNFLPLFYFRNNLIWADGFLIDFLQKKTADLLTRKFFLFTGFLFSERFIFEIVVKLYLDTLVWPLHAISFFEAMNTMELLSTLLSFYFLFFSFLILLLLLL